MYFKDPSFIDLSIFELRAALYYLKKENCSQEEKNSAFDHLETALRVLTPRCSHSDHRFWRCVSCGKQLDPKEIISFSDSFLGRTFFYRDGTKEFCSFEEEEEKKINIPDIKKSQDIIKEEKPQGENSQEEKESESK